MTSRNKYLSLNHLHTNVDSGWVFPACHLQLGAKLGLGLRLRLYVIVQDFTRTCSVSFLFPFPMGWHLVRILKCCRKLTLYFYNSCFDDRRRNEKPFVLARSTFVLQGIHIRLSQHFPPHNCNSFALSSAWDTCFIWHSYSSSFRFNGFHWFKDFWRSECRVGGGGGTLFFLAMETRVQKNVIGIESLLNQTGCVLNRLTGCIVFSLDMIYFCRWGWGSGFLSCIPVLIFVALLYFHVVLLAEWDGTGF